MLHFKYCGLIVSNYPIDFFNLILKNRPYEDVCPGNGYAINKRIPKW